MQLEGKRSESLRSTSTRDTRIGGMKCIWRSPSLNAASGNPDTHWFNSRQSPHINNGKELFFFAILYQLYVCCISIFQFWCFHYIQKQRFRTNSGGTGDFPVNDRDCRMRFNPNSLTVHYGQDKGGERKIQFSAQVRRVFTTQITSSRDIESHIELKGPTKHVRRKGGVGERNLCVNLMYSMRAESVLPAKTYEN